MQNVNNVPLLSPLYPSNFVYGTPNYHGITLLLEAPPELVKDLIKGTTLEYLTPHIVLSLEDMGNTYGVKSFKGLEPMVPVRHKPTGTYGGYLPFCYVTEDDSLALGREPWGYPKKIAKIDVIDSENVMSASIEIPGGRIDVSVALNDSLTTDPIQWPDVATHILYQLIPSTQPSEPLIERLIGRNAAAISDIKSQPGIGSMKTRIDDESMELAFLNKCKIVAARINRGVFKGANGTLLETIHVGSELLQFIEKTQK